MDYTVLCAVLGGFGQHFYADVARLDYVTETHVGSCLEFVEGDLLMGLTAFHRRLSRWPATPIRIDNACLAEGFWNGVSPTLGRCFVDSDNTSYKRTTHTAKRHG